MPSYILPPLPPQINTLRHRYLLPTILSHTTSFSTSLGQGGGAAGDGDDEEEGDEAADHIMSTLSAHASILPHVSYILSLALYYITHTAVSTYAHDVLCLKLF